MKAIPINRTALPTIIAIVAIIVLSLAAAAVWAATAEPHDALRALQAQYGQIEQAHLKAHYTLTLDFADRPSISGGGAFEYWASDRRFRVESSASPALRAIGIGVDRTITFDGKEGALYLPGTSTLAVRSGEFADSSIIPNPLWLPLGFVGLQSHACDGCRLGLVDVHDAENWLRVHKSFSASAPAAGSAAVKLKMTAAPSEGAPSTVLLSRRDGAWLVEEVVTERPQGGVPGQPALLERQVFDHAAAAAGSLPQLLIPRHMVIGAQGHGLPGGAQSARLEIAIDELQVNAPIDQSFFTTPRELASTVIDEDLQRIVKAAHCARKGAQ